MSVYTYMYTYTPTYLDTYILIWCNPITFSSMSQAHFASHGVPADTVRMDSRKLDFSVFASSKNPAYFLERDFPK